MNNFICGRKTIEFSTVTGEVLDTQKHSETHISGGQTSGTIVGGTGFVSGSGVSSSVSTQHEIWIKTQDGLEKAIRLRNVDIPLRSGQRITLVLATTEGIDDRYYCMLCNHDAGKYWFITRANRLKSQLGLVPTGKYFLITFLLAVGVFVFFDGIAVLINIEVWFLSLIFCFIVSLPMILVRGGSIDKSLEAHLHNLGKEILQNYS